jgi:hypothetical protein
MVFVSPALERGQDVPEKGFSGSILGPFEGPERIGGWLLLGMRMSLWTHGGPCCSKELRREILPQQWRRRRRLVLLATLEFGARGRSQGEGVVGLRLL